MIRKFIPFIPPYKCFESHYPVGAPCRFLNVPNVPYVTAQCTLHSCNDVGPNFWQHRLDLKNCCLVLDSQYISNWFPWSQFFVFVDENNFEPVIICPVFSAEDWPMVTVYPAQWSQPCLHQPHPPLTPPRALRLFWSSFGGGGIEPQNMEY